MQKAEDRHIEASGSGRRRLMSAASRLFARSGLSEVTVAQILDQSGVKAPTLYHHFGGKEGLYVNWACHTLDVMSAEFTALSASGPTLRDFLLESCHILLSPRSMDVLQVMRDRRWLADPDSVEQVDDALRAAVFLPISRAISAATPIIDATDASQAFVHMVSLRRPCYMRSDSVEPPPADEIVDLFLSGVLASTRTGLGNMLVQDGLPDSPVEVK